MRRIFAQTRKELTQIVRDYRTLALALALPLVLLLLLGSAISLTVDNLPIVVQDLDHTPASQDLHRRVPRLGHLSRGLVAGDRRPEACSYGEQGSRRPHHPRPDFGREIARGDSAPVQLLVDGSDSNTARLISGDASRDHPGLQPSMPAA